MINGFEKHTHDLTEYEFKTLLPVLISGFRSKIGEDRSVTSDHIVNTLKTKGYKISNVRVRKLINYIRNNNLVPFLVANSKGYYIETDINKMKKYIESLKQRANEINRTANSLEKQLKTAICQY
tara:strand:+ start:786 stop:1157 length:372 start_codon:yes stop_codon:yes gene_type:complete